MFRLHLAEEPKKQSLPEVEKALAYFRKMNDSPGHWARFKAIRFKSKLKIEVEVGLYYHKGTTFSRKESKSYTRSFWFDQDSEMVDYHDTPHF